MAVSLENNFKSMEPTLGQRKILYWILRFFYMKFECCEALFFFHSYLFLPCWISALKSRSGASPRSASSVGVTSYIKPGKPGGSRLCTGYVRATSIAYGEFASRPPLLSLKPHIWYPVRQWWIAFWTKQSSVRFLYLLWYRNGEHTKIHAAVRILG